MLSLNNMLLPSNGEPTVAPTLDMVLGCYYLTMLKPGSRGEGKIFSDLVRLAWPTTSGAIELRAQIKVRAPNGDGENHLLDTTVGRVIFNESVNNCLRQAGCRPLPYRNDHLDKAALKSIISH